MHNVINFYLNKISHLSAQERRLKARSNACLYAKLLFFLGVVVFAYWTYRHFGWLNLTAALLCANEIDGLGGTFSAFRDGSEYVNPQHEYAYDLDLFGKDSLFNRINRTVTRKGSDRLAERLTRLSEDKQEMYDLTMKLLSLNKERQKRGEDAWNESRSAAKASLESFGSKFILLDTGKTPRGLTGSLASRALNEFTSSPAVIVLSQCEGDRISASIRSRESLNCRDFLSKFSSFFTDFGGHKRAGGFSMKIENKDGFKKALEEEVMKMDIGGEEEEVLSVDALISENDMNLNLMKVVELFEPYGEANKPLVFLFSGAKIADIITLGDPSKGNIKLTLQIGRTLWPCLWWGGRNSEGFDYEVGDTIKLVFRLNRNYYKGMDNVQLTLLQCEKENPVH